MESPTRKRLSTNHASESIPSSFSENHVTVLHRDINNTFEDGNENVRENNYVSCLWLTLTNNLKKFNANDLKQVSFG